ncbi:MAG: tetratricopeptide repeat protein [Candidatus Thorarchaeota archaeon]
MQNIYIPLYYSNLQNYIPDGEEILYSAFYKVFYKESYLDPFKSNKKWDTHVLITRKGIYFGQYQRKWQPRVKYIGWHMVKKIKKKSIKISRLEYKFKIKREPNIENRKNFKIRKKEAYSKLLSIMNEGVKIVPKEFLKQLKSSRIKAENEKVQLQEIIGDKYEKRFDKVFDILQFQKHLRGDYRFGRNALYKDIRKNRMINQVQWETIHLILAIYGLAFLPMSIALGIFLVFNELVFSIMISSLILLTLILFHRYWIRKKNFELRKDVKFFKKAKSQTEQHFIQSFSEVPRNFDGLQLMRLMKLGGDAYKERDFEKSAKIFQKILKINPNIDMNWYMLLESLFYLSKWEDMVSFGEEAIKLHPNFGNNYHWVADAYNELGNKEKATEYYKRAVELLSEVLEKDPNDDTTLNSLGYNYLKLERYEDAVKSYKEAIKIRPKSEHHLHSLGQTYMKMGIYDKAIKYLEESLKYNPKHSYSWFDLGLIYEDLNELKRAIEYFEKAVEYYPQWVKIREKLIEIKPDSPVLFKKSQELKEKTAGDNLYDTLHKQGLEDRMKKVETDLDRLLNMNTRQLRIYLTALVSNYRRRIEKFKDNKHIPPFMIERLKIQKEYKEQILVHLRESTDYIFKFRKIVENDIEFYRMRTQKKEIIREKYLESLFNLLLEMPYDQLVTYLKEEILFKQEKIKYDPMDDKETEMRNLALIYTKETLKKLEENRANIQIFRKEVKKGLDELINGEFSVYNDKMFYMF